MNDCIVWITARLRRLDDWLCRIAAGARALG